MRRHAASHLCLAILLLLALAPLAEAHRQGLRPGYTRLVYDCAHDWGWESGRPADMGHELVTLDVIERDVDGRPLLLFELNLVQAETLGRPVSYEMRETLTFTTPRGTYATTLRTTNENQFTYLDGLAPVYIGPRKPGVSAGQGEDPSLIAVDVGYAYEQLKIQKSERVTGYRVLAEYQDPTGAWKRGDVMPGGATAIDGREMPACDDGKKAPEDDDMYYVAPHFVVERRDCCSRHG